MGMTTVGERIWATCRKAESDAIEHDQPFGLYDEIVTLRDQLNQFGFGLRLNMGKGHLFVCVVDREGDEITFRNDIFMTLGFIRNFPQFQVKNDYTSVVTPELKSLFHGLSAEEKRTLFRFLQEELQEQKEEPKANELTIGQANAVLDQMRTLPMDIREAAAKYLLKDGDQA